MRNLRFELPDQWRIQPHSAPPGSNTMRGPKDFAGVVRSSNRMLKRMFNEWQTEVESIKERHASQLNLETVQSTQVLMEKNEYAAKVSNLEAANMALQLALNEAEKKHKHELNQAQEKYNEAEKKHKNGPSRGPMRRRWRLSPTKRWQRRQLSRRPSVLGP